MWTRTRSTHNEYHEILFSESYSHSFIHSMLIYPFYACSFPPLICWILSDSAKFDLVRCHRKCRSVILSLYYYLCSLDSIFPQDNIHNLHTCLLANRCSWRRRRHCLSSGSMHSSCTGNLFSFFLDSCFNIIVRFINYASVDRYDLLPFISSLFRFNSY